METRTVLVTVSVTSQEGAEPLVAARVLENGQEVNVPLTLVLGHGEASMVVTGNHNSVGDLVGQATLLLNASTKMAGSVIAAAAKAAEVQPEEKPKRGKGRGKHTPASMA